MQLVFQRKCLLVSGKRRNLCWVSRHITHLIICNHIIVMQAIFQTYVSAHLSKLMFQIFYPDLERQIQSQAYLCLKRFNIFDDCVESHRLTCSIDKCFIHKCAIHVYTQPHV